MRFNLWHDNVKVGDVITDKPLVKGEIVQTVWRVVNAAFQVDARDPTNSVPSGNVLVEPVTKPDTIEGVKAAFELEFKDFAPLYHKTPEAHIKTPEAILREANEKIISRFEENILEIVVRVNGGERESWRHNARGHAYQTADSQITKIIAPLRAKYAKLFGSSTPEAEIARDFDLPFLYVQRHFS